MHSWVVYAAGAVVAQVTQPDSSCSVSYLEPCSHMELQFGDVPGYMRPVQSSVVSERHLVSLAEARQDFRMVLELAVPGNTVEAEVQRELADAEYGPEGSFGEQPDVLLIAVIGSERRIVALADSPSMNETIAQKRRVSPLPLPSVDASFHHCFRKMKLSLAFEYQPVASVFLVEESPASREFPAQLHCAKGLYILFRTIS